MKRVTAAACLASAVVSAVVTFATLTVVALRPGRRTAAATAARG